MTLSEDSLGGMFDGFLVQNLDPMNITSKRRNPVADIFRRLRLMEPRGSGFKKIMEDYHAYLASEKQMPKFCSDAHDFFTVLPNLNYGQEGSIWKKKLPRLLPRSLPRKHQI
jgi:ATP-dependent DNA helicase RecG